MTNALLTSVAGVFFGLFFVFLLLTGIKLKNRLRLLFSLVSIGLAIACFGWVSIIAANKLYKKGQRIITSVAKTLEPRTGSEIYNDLFGQPLTDCVKVAHSSDQVIPRLDCCVWLDFQTCPLELRRIIALDRYELLDCTTSDSVACLPHYSPRPVWWDPAKLNKTIVLRSYDSKNSNRDRILVFAQDSTYAYYCDMAD